MTAYVIFLGGSGSSGGGGTTTQLDSTGFYVVSANNPTITTADISPAPTIGDKILFAICAAGPSDAPTVTYGHPSGTIIKEYLGSNYFPRMRIIAVDYTGATNNFDFTSNVLITVGAVVVPGATTYSASTPVGAFSPVDPGPVTGALAGCLGLTFTCTNFNTAAITGPSPDGHSTILNLTGGARNLHIQKRQLTTAATYDPTPMPAGAGEETTSISVVCFPAGSGGGSGGGGTSIPPPTIPTFNTSTAIQITPSTPNVAALVASYPAGTHFSLSAGTFSNISDIRPKTNMHFRGQGASTILEGSGKAYCFRAGAIGTSDNVTIGNLLIRNYGLGTSRAEYGAIQAQPTDTVGNVYDYGCPTGWFIYDCTLEKNSSNGIRISDNCTVYRCTAYGHTVTGIGGDRNVGGLIHSCTLEANALNPATGNASNGAQIKVTFLNGDEGRTSQLSGGALRPKAHFTVANCVFNATKSGFLGTCEIGFWADLDVKDVEVVDCQFSNHPSTSVFFEGSNDGVVRNCVITNSDGYGPAYGSNFVNAGLAFGESTNMLAEGNTLIGCDYALMNRMSNRTGDWLTSNGSGFTNFAYSAGPRYWITAGTPAPIPSPAARSNIWTGNITFRNNVLVGCSKVVINEGNNANGQTTQGSTDLSSIHFEGNAYDQSPGIQFFNLSNTGIGLAAWQALPYDRDQ